MGAVTALTPPFALPLVILGNVAEPEGRLSAATTAKSLEEQKSNKEKLCIKCRQTAEKHQEDGCCENQETGSRPGELNFLQKLSECQVEITK